MTLSKISHFDMYKEREKNGFINSAFKANASKAYLGPPAQCHPKPANRYRLVTINSNTCQLDNCLSRKLTSYDIVQSCTSFILCTFHTAIGTASASSANYVESDLGCTSRICFDNVGDNVKLTLDNVTLTSQKPSQHNNKCECSKTNGYKWSLCCCCFSVKYRYSDNLLK